MQNLNGEILGFVPPLVMTREIDEIVAIAEKPVRQVMDELARDKVVLAEMVRSRFQAAEKEPADWAGSVRLGSCPALLRQASASSPFISSMSWKRSARRGWARLLSAAPIATSNSSAAGASGIRNWAVRKWERLPVSVL
ncbi:hypothetical protein M2427_004456 [Bradyrhizobium sp. BR13661]|jgi:hypothetical protein|nr:hypothetical protein [Bradyrhizobium sp. BR13661]